MSKVKQIGMAAGTFSVALGIGFVMQNGDALASRFGSDTEMDRPAPFVQDEAIEVSSLSMVPDMQPMATSVEEDSDLEIAQASLASTDSPAIDMPKPDITAAVTLPEQGKIEPQQEAPVQLAALDPETVPDIEIDAPASVEVDCVPEMTARAGQAAMVDLSVSAPCHAGVAFTIHHQGMMFTAKTDGDGVAVMAVPALAEVAVMIAAFEDGNGAVATTAVPDFASYDRAVLQWQGDTAVMLSAYEDGAGFGDAAHIHAANPGNMERVTSAEGGYLVRLGDTETTDALMAEIYTFPTGMLGRAPDVMLAAEAEITSGNCGKEMSAQSIQISPDGGTSALDLTMIMPDCDAVGDFLILQNMFEDLTLAAR